MNSLCKNANVYVRTHTDARDPSSARTTSRFQTRTEMTTRMRARVCGAGGCISAFERLRTNCTMLRAISRIARPATRTFRPVIHQSTLQRSARAWSRPLSTSDGDDADARATDDYAPADDATNVVDEDAPAPLLTPKQRGISKKAPPLSEKQKKKLAAQWADYVEYMDHQRTQGWKT